MKVIGKRNQEVYINLPSTLYNNLKDICRDQEDINIDLAALILHTIIIHQSEETDWVPLSSVILRKNDHKKYKYSKHVEILEINGLIKTLPHQHNLKGKENTSRRFTIPLKTPPVEYEQEMPFVPHAVRGPLAQKIVKHSNKKKIEAASTTRHLTKWLDSGGFTINEKEAVAYVEENYPRDSRHYSTRRQKIASFNPSFSYMRDGKDDRLHSTFTLLPNDLKKFVRYQGYPLEEVDFKSSQPMIFSILLQRILGIYDSSWHLAEQEQKKYLKKEIKALLMKWINNGKKDYYNRDKYTLNINIKSIYITIILQEQLEEADFTEFHRFIFLVQKGTLYEEIGNSLLNTGGIWNSNDRYLYKAFDKVERKQKEISFATLRKCAKTVFISSMYAGKGLGSNKAANDVKRLFPSLFRFIDGLTENYKDFSILLQRIEAKFMLDYCAKKIANEFPKMPLVTRHDSISTIEPMGDLLYKKVLMLSRKYFDQDIKITKELW